MFGSKNRFPFPIEVPEPPSFYAIQQVEKGSDGKIQAIEPEQFFQRTRETPWSPWEEHWTRSLFEATRFHSRDQARTQLGKLQGHTAHSLEITEVW